MTYSEDILKRVKAFGLVQYTVEKIVSIMAPENADQFVADLRDPESVLCIMYQSGLNSGQFRLDVEQFKQSEIETQTAKLEYEQEVASINLRKELFGI